MEIEQIAEGCRAEYDPKVKRVLNLSFARPIVHEGIVSCVRFSPDGKYLATACDRTVSLYDTHTGLKHSSLKDRNAPDRYNLFISCVYFSPDGKYLAAGGPDTHIRIWDVATEQVVRVLEGHKGGIQYLAFSANGNFIASTSSDNTVRIWDTTTGEQKTLEIKKLSGDDVKGDKLGKDDNSDHARNGDSKEDSEDDEDDDEGYKNESTKNVNTDYYAIGVAISPDGSLVAAACLDNVIRIWDIETGNLVEILRGHSDCVYCVTFMPDGKGLVSGAFDKTVRCWDLTPFLNRCDPKEPLVPATIPSAIANFRVKEGGDHGSTCTTTLVGHSDLVLGVALSRDGRWVFSGSKDHHVIIWDTQTGEKQVKLVCHANSVVSLDISPEDGMFATGGGDWCAKLWRYSTVPGPDAAA